MPCPCPQQAIAIQLLALTARTSHRDPSAGHDRQPVAIAEVPCLGRSFPALTQPQVLRALQGWLQGPAPGSGASGPAELGGSVSNAGQGTATGAKGGAASKAAGASGPVSKGSTPGGSGEAASSEAAAGARGRVKATKAGTGQGTVAEAAAGGSTGSNDGVARGGSGQAEEGLSQGTGLEGAVDEAWLFQVVSSLPLRREYRQRLCDSAAVSFGYRQHSVQVVFEEQAKGKAGGKAGVQRGGSKQVALGKQGAVGKQAPGKGPQQAGDTEAVSATGPGKQGKEAGESRKKRHKSDARDDDPMEVDEQGVTPGAFAVATHTAAGQAQRGLGSGKRARE